VHLDVSQSNTDAAAVAQVCFTIRDTGVGISKEFLPHLFQPFSQEHSGSTSSYGGSGLGLAISRNLAQLMGGEIAVSSTPGEGTTFTVHIPLGISVDLPQAPASKDRPDAAARYDFSGKRFLLVEDHQLNIMVARKLLEFKNARVDVAENGKLCLDRLAASPEYTYDAILMDIRMPVMDGLQAARSIRNSDSAWAKAVPILAMSANAFDEDVLKSKHAGMSAHLAKPIDPEQLYRTLDQLLTLKKEEPDGSDA
ncbi:MAG: response regulator, partial [Oscillibacter sp.]